MNQEELEKLLNTCLNELTVVHQGECSTERAERNAALFLEAQFRLSEYLSGTELQAKRVKYEIERVASQKYFEYKSGALGNEKKLTEAALEHAISKDDEIFKMKEDMILKESEYKKWNYIMNILSNGHIMYRGMSRRDNI